MAIATCEKLEGRTMFAAPGGYGLYRADDFSGSAVNTANFVNDAEWLDHQPAGELETFRPQNALVQGGNLTLRAEKVNGSYFSGEITSGGTWSGGGNIAPEWSFDGHVPGHGVYLEARIKFAKSQPGEFGAWWAMPTAYGPGQIHDGDGEQDYVEAVGNDPNIASFHLHHGGSQGRDYNTGADVSLAYHVYGCLWTATQMVWYFDGAPVFTVTSNLVTVPEHFIFDNAIGAPGSWPGTPTASNVYPSDMLVDYVREYRQGAVTANPYDLNGDGVENAADLGIFSQNYGKRGANLPGDFDSSGSVDVGDLGKFAVGYAAITGATPAQVSLAIVTATEADGRRHGHRRE